MRYIILSLLCCWSSLSAQNNCQIADLSATLIGPAPNSCQYFVVLNFEHEGTTNQFTVMGNGNNYGTFSYEQVPLTLGPFTAGTVPSVREFVVKDAVLTNCKDDTSVQIPACGNTGNCLIVDVSLDPGDCIPGTNNYSLTIDFEVLNTTNGLFELWSGNGQYLGYYPLSQLPLTLPSFPGSGNAEDQIKICINDNPNCCKTLGFLAPDCEGGLPCQFGDLLVDVGQCSGDSSYALTLNFLLSSANGVDSFLVWANGAYFGKYGINQLPLTIPNFPWNGGNFDAVKVCTGNIAECCKVREFEVPGCLLEDCDIYDLQVLRTPCLCGQFFAVLSFEHENGGSDGFEIVGNGTNYGTFSYEQPQPIILGPLPGDGSTMYEFAVRDLLSEDCADDVMLGKVTCEVAATASPNAIGQLSLAPNPAKAWLSVGIRLASGLAVGPGEASVFAADGRRVLTHWATAGGQFSLDVSGLAPGVYRLVFSTETGRLEGVFSKI